MKKMKRIYTSQLGFHIVGKINTILKVKRFVTLQLFIRIKIFGYLQIKVKKSE